MNIPTALPSPLLEALRTIVTKLDGSGDHQATLAALQLAGDPLLADLAEFARAALWVRRTEMAASLDIATDCHNRLSSTLTFGDCCCDDHATCTCHRNSSAGACDTCLSLSHERADDSLRDLLIVLADVDQPRALALIDSATAVAA